MFTSNTRPVTKKPPHVPEHLFGILLPKVHHNALQIYCTIIYYTHYNNIILYYVVLQVLKTDVNKFLGELKVCLILSNLPENLARGRVPVGPEALDGDLFDVHSLSDLESHQRVKFAKIRLNFLGEHRANQRAARNQNRPITARRAIAFQTKF